MFIVCNCRGPDRATREEHNPLQLLVVKEIVKGPKAPLLTERVRVQIRVVAEKGIQNLELLHQHIGEFKAEQMHPPVYIAARQVDLLVDGVPQLGPQRVKLLPYSGEQAAVHCIGHLREKPHQIFTRLFLTRHIWSH